MNDTASTIAIRRRRGKRLSLTCLFILALISIADNLKGGTSFWSSLISHALMITFYHMGYNNMISWLSMPWPRRRPSSPGKQTVLVGLIVLLSLLSILIMGTWLGNLDPQNRSLFQIGIVPWFVIHDWVFLAIVLGVTEHLPLGWEKFWRRPEVFPARFDSDDRQALALAIGGLLIGNGAAIVRVFLATGTDFLGWVTLGVLLVDFYALGAIFWSFRSSFWWGILVIGVWTLFNNFAMGVVLAWDIGAFIEWLLNRALDLIS